MGTPGLPRKDTVVEGNQFNLYSNNYTYGLTLEISQGAKVENNTLNLTGRAGIYAMELYSAWSNDISFNNIYADGSFSEVGLYGSSGNSITNNTIYSFGDGINDPAQGPEHPDSVSLINTGILLEKGSNGNIIADNIIVSDGDYAITIDGSVGNSITNNQLSSSKGKGDAAITDNTGSNYISGNTGLRSNSEGSNSNSNPRRPIHTNGTSSSSGNSGNSQSNGASAYGDVNSNFNANAQSSANDGAGDSGEAGDGSDLIASELADSEHLGKKSRETLARRLIDNEEDKIAQNLNKTDIVTKIGPTLGLMGTLIPMGPGLAALGTGDVTTLAGEITSAFNTTVIGIGAGAIAYFASKLRRRWFGEYLANLDALVDAILDNIDKRDERLK